MSVQRPMITSRVRERDSRGRFVKAPKATPLTAQQVGDLTALILPEEAEPANCLATTAVYTVHASWWEWQPLKGEHPA
jgi:hypothetical protein